MHGTWHSSVLQDVTSVRGTGQSPDTGAATTARRRVIVPPLQGLEQSLHCDHADTMQPPGQGDVLQRSSWLVKPQPPPTDAGAVTLRFLDRVPTPHSWLDGEGGESASIMGAEW